MSESKIKIVAALALAAVIGPMALAQRTPGAEGPFEGSWESLAKYSVPDWFRDAKFGIWAHWGPQCQPEAGDWYARGMYEEGSPQYQYHIAHYGHPSEFGFKDVINEWKAEKWEPRKLMELYKRTGAKYFMAMANHHDNLDLWDSPYHAWNSVNMGPRRDILAEWKAAAEEQGLPFGVSVHSAHAWSWYETAQGADRKGPKAGISYDARVLTKEDGIGKWWEGYDPEELYVQHHALSNPEEHFWDWPEGVARPTREYTDDFFNRTTQMIDSYKPDLIYFDDSWAPFWPVDSTGLDVIAHYYNRAVALNDGANPEVVVFGKKLNPQQGNAIVWDVEKGVLDTMNDTPWQTCTCLGNWHYDRSCYNDNRYKSARTVVEMLVDVVSKNGNLLLSVPVRGDGTIDEKEEAILADIAAWLEVNGEGIYGTRPWKVYGEGPSTLESKPLDGPGFTENRAVPYTSADVRYTTTNDYL
ncbi:MAG: alpha-L-fucosidase, partial [Muribaculaceae bacterium]|nr:alpha-L-fucosidase [Muribaculaceae bacterium]